MNFGDWEMFKVIIVSLREQELTNVMKQDEGRNVRFSVVKPHQQSSSSLDKRGERIGRGDSGVAIRAFVVYGFVWFCRFWVEKWSKYEREG